MVAGSARHSAALATSLALAAGCLAPAAWTPARAAAPADAPKAVVFDMEPAQLLPTPANMSRLRDATALLRRSVADKGLALVDTAPQAKRIADNLPLSTCNGCDRDIAAALGADLEVATAMQQLSAQTFSLSGSISDVKSGRVLRQGVVSIQGEDAAAWDHAVKYLVRERLFTPPLPPRS